MEKKLKVFILFSITIAMLLSCTDGRNNYMNKVVGLAYVEVKNLDTAIEGSTLTYPVPSTARTIFTKSRKVRLNSYYVSNFETTYDLWKEVYDWAVENDYVFKNQGKKGSNGEGSMNQPVTEISWQDAIVWCNAYTEKTVGIEECVYRSGDADGTVIKNATNATDENLTISQMKKNMLRKGYRLPTEAEWEFAARFRANNINAVECNGVFLTKINSASGADVNYTDEEGTMKYGWLKKNSDKTTHPVGKKLSNELEIYDMTGNVFEFCFDWNGVVIENDEDYKNTKGEIENPFGVTKAQSKTCQHSYGEAKRVMRSCSYNMMSSVTCLGHKGITTPTGKSCYIGFRVVKTK